MLSKFFDIEDDGFNFDKERRKFIDNLNFLKAMSVQESTLYKKWQELNQDLYNTQRKSSKYDQLKKRIWQPTDITNKDLTISEIENLEPYVQIVSSTSSWTALRMMISSMEFTGNPGRNIKFFVKDKNTNSFLGVLSVGSDVTSLGVRDKYIGWTKENKFEHGRLNHTCIGTSIVPTQPLGFNFLGGKLLSALVTSSTVRDAWKEMYENILVGVTTTSLYGVHSQYNGIPHWKTLGETTGRIGLKPDDEYYKIWHKWVKENKAHDYQTKILDRGKDISGPVTGVKQRILEMIFKTVGVSQSKYMHGYKRGAFFANMYENGFDFLQNKIEEKDLVMKPKFVGDIDYILNWWKPKAIRRYIKLYDNNNLKPDKLFYMNIIGMSWEETKQKYLGDVGR